MPKPRTVRKTPALRSCLDDPHELAVGRGADVEVAVGREDDAVGALGDEGSLRGLVGELDAFAAGSGASRLEAVDRIEDRVLARAWSRLEDDARGAGVDDEGDPILLPHPAGEYLERLLDERQLVLVLHRAGDVDEEDEVRGRDLAVGYPLGLQRDSEQTVRRVPGAGRELAVEREGRLPVARIGREGPSLRVLRDGVLGHSGSRVFVREVVDELLDADGVGRRKGAFAQESPNVRIRRGVHVDREGRQRFLQDLGERGLDDAVVALGVEVRIVARASEGIGKGLGPFVSDGLLRLLRGLRGRRPGRGGGRGGDRRGGGALRRLPPELAGSGRAPANRGRGRRGRDSLVVGREPRLVVLRRDRGGLRRFGG